MNITGKCRPKTSTFVDLLDMGYQNVELYLTKEMLDTRTDIIEVSKESDLNISSVHTPHINDIGERDIMKYMKQSDLIADELDATFLLHSQPFSTLSLSQYYTPDMIESDSFCYENHPDVSAYSIENYFLDQGYPIALDVAHLYMAEDSILSTIKHLIDSYKSNQIPVIHLADGTRYNDGLDFENGSIDIPIILDLLEYYEYDGDVVLEVPVDAREDAIKYIKRVRSEI